jgi:hypothetical protein
VVTETNGSPTNLSDSETITVTVGEVNLPPILDPVGDQSTDELVNLSFTATASDPDDPANLLTFSLSGAPVGASITGAGDFSWTPTEAQGPGSYTFDVVVTDNTSLEDRETITVTVAEVNQAPVIVDPGDQTGGEGVAGTLLLVGSDEDDPANSLTWSATGLPEGLSIDPVTGEISGVVAVGAAAVSPWMVKVYLDDDGSPAMSSTVEFVWVIAENHAPLAGPDFYEVEPGGTLTVSASGVLANDSDPDSDALIAAVVAPTSAGSLTLVADGSFTYVHNGGPTVEDVFVYQAEDGRGGITSATVKISILSPNLPPILNSDLLTLLEDGVGSVAPLANDSDPNGDLLSLVDFSQPEFGFLEARADGILNYTPPADFFGEVTASYTADDGKGGRVTGSITIVVEPVNDLPVGGRDAANLAAYLPFVFDVLANDVDIEGDRLRVIDLVGSPVGEVTLNEDGTITYRPATGFVGVDTFEYLVADGVGGVDTVSVSVTIPAEVLSAALAQGELIGSPTLGFRAPEADLSEGPSVTLGITQGVSLMADAFFQSLGALQLPILFLGLALGTIVILGGFTEIPLLLATRRRRYYSVVLLDREHRLAAREDPDLDANALYYYEPNAAGFRSLDKLTNVDGRGWIPVESPNGSGWVEAQYVTEAVDLQFFLNDDVPVAMLRRLADDLMARRDVSEMFSKRGFAVALTNEPRMIPADEFRAALTNHSESAATVGLWDEVLQPLGAALRAAEDLDSRSSHSRTALIPVELWNFQYLAVNADGHPPWLVYFEYEKGKPKIVGVGVDV